MLSAGPKGVCLKESWLYIHEGSRFNFTMLNTGTTAGHKKLIAFHALSFMRCVKPILNRLNFVYLFFCLQRKGQEGFDPDFDEESTMVEDSVTPSK